jgi:hypothetical protein
MSLGRAGVVLVGAVLLASCNDKEIGPATITAAAPEQPGTLELIANGGNADGSGTANGGDGCRIVVHSRGNIFWGRNPAPLPPPLPATPVTGTPVSSWSGVQTIASGNGIVNGDITVTSSESSATLEVASGDLVINGNITALAEVNLMINAPGGTVFFHGAVRTGRIDGTDSGDSGGNVFITALRIIFTGSIDTRGEDNPAGPGGWGGNVNFITDTDGGSATGQTSQILVGGSILMSGGNGSGPNSRGGTGGNFQTSGHRGSFEDHSHFSGAADGAVHVIGTTIDTSGGSATGTGKVVGGGSGYWYWMGDRGFFFNGSAIGRGGDAVSTDGEARGGTASAVYVNEFTTGNSGPIAIYGSIDLSGGSAVCGPSSKAVGGGSPLLEIFNKSDINFGAGTVSLRGGNSTGKGGGGGSVSLTFEDGVPGDIHVDTAIEVSSGSGMGEQNLGTAGSLTFLSELGDIDLGGSFVLDGGSGSSADPAKGPSAGGFMRVRAGDGDFTDGGSITLRGSIRANGGSIANSINPNKGANGGRIELICDNPVGSIYLDPGSSIELDGGAGSPGGSGGILLLHTSGGIVGAGSDGGNISMRGSIISRGGPGAGLGGLVHAQSDIMGGADGRGGDITLHAGATIEVSGGVGGGNALSDGSSSASFPVAVFFDADGNDSNNPLENGVVQNFGLIIARGEPENGKGGDIRFDGLNPALSVGPSSGSMDLMGAGSGLGGGFKSE